jgi:hypothetical protein
MQKGLYSILYPILQKIGGTHQKHPVTMPLLVRQTFVGMLLYIKRVACSAL